MSFLILEISVCATTRIKLYPLIIINKSEHNNDHCLSIRGKHYCNFGLVGHFFLLAVSLDILKRWSDHDDMIIEIPSLFLFFFKFEIEKKFQFGNKHLGIYTAMRPWSSKPIIDISIEQIEGIHFGSKWGECQFINILNMFLAFLIVVGRWSGPFI